MALRRLAPLLAIFPALPALAACVETGTYEKTVSQLEDARHAATQKDDQLRAYQWQVASLGQQLREAQQRSDALQRELFAQVQQLTAANSTLLERLKKLEAERAALIAAAEAPPPAVGKDGKPSREGLRPEELRRMIAAADARNAQIVEELARIERLLSGSREGPPAPRSHPPGEVQPHPPTDAVDPWGFGSRK